MPIVICLINQKGGCGKSSTCYHLAGALAAMNYRVLLVDTDPQGSLGQGFFGSEFVENLAAEETIASLFQESEFIADHDRLLQQTPIKQISICLANQHLAPFNSTSPQRLGMAQFALRGFLEHHTDVDFVLIDCPPNLYRCSWTAMIASDYVVIPVPPEDFGTQGLRAVHQAIDNARLLNPSLRCLGHLVTRSDRRLLVHGTYESKLRELYSDCIFGTTIAEAAAFKVAIACRQPVEQFAPRSRAACLTRQLAHEILQRVGMNPEQRRVA